MEIAGRLCETPYQYNKLASALQICSQRPVAGRTAPRASDYRGVGVLGGSFDVPIETAGKRRFQLAQAGSFSEAARLNIAIVAWRVRSRVRKSLLDLYAGREIGNQLRFQQGTQQESV